MRLVQRIGDLSTIFQDLIRRQRSLPEAFTEGLPFETLQHEIGLAIVLADVV